MLVLRSGPMIKRLFSISVLIFGRTSSSASTVSDSLPVCSRERLPAPFSSTSSKPLTSLGSLVKLLVLLEVSPCEEDELPCLLEPADEETTEEILPFSQVSFKVPLLIRCTERTLPTVRSICMSPSELISHSSGLSFSS